MKNDTIMNGKIKLQINYFHTERRVDFPELVKINQQQSVSKIFRSEQNLRSKEILW
jgi:hypothetical protein